MFRAAARTAAHRIIVRLILLAVAQAAALVSTVAYFFLI